MPDDPERYVTADELQEELPFGEETRANIDDWEALLERFLDEESERIEGPDYAGREFDDVPGPVKNAVVRLVRSRLEQIKTDGVESESLASGLSMTYRPPEAIRRDVQSMVRKYRDDEDHPGAWVV